MHVGCHLPCTRQPRHFLGPCADTCTSGVSWPTRVWLEDAVHAHGMLQSSCVQRRRGTAAVVMCQHPRVGAADAAFAGADCHKVHRSAREGLLK